MEVSLVLVTMVTCVRQHGSEDAMRLTPCDPKHTCSFIQSHDELWQSDFFVIWDETVDLDGTPGRGTDLVPAPSQRVQITFNQLQTTCSASTCWTSGDTGNQRREASN